MAHTIGKNGGKARNLITTNNLVTRAQTRALDADADAEPEPDTVPSTQGHGARRHASSTTSSHDHRQHNSGTSPNSYSSTSTTTYSTPSNQALAFHTTFQALHTRTQVPSARPRPRHFHLSPLSSPPDAYSSLPASPAPHTARTRIYNPRRVHHNYAFLEPSTSVSSPCTSPAPSSCWSLPHPTSGQPSIPSPRSKRAKPRSHRCVQTFPSPFSSLFLVPPLRISISIPSPKTQSTSCAFRSFLCEISLSLLSDRLYALDPISLTLHLSFGVSSYVLAPAHIVTFSTNSFGGQSHIIYIYSL